MIEKTECYTKTTEIADDFGMKTVCFSSLHSRKAREKQAAVSSFS
ncbi:hypothetical protein [[Clostridium] innocuum]|nr:hypothetical protein [[Clostridium] innocuum]